ASCTTSSSLPRVPPPIITASGRLQRQFFCRTSTLPVECAAGSLGDCEDPASDGGGLRDVYRLLTYCCVPECFRHAAGGIEMKFILMAFVTAGFIGSGILALADSPKIKAAIEVLGCTGGKMEKETEGSGYFEVDDAKCRDGQY